MQAPEPHRPVIVLGIETSCDETAVAIVVRDHEGSGTILANLVRSQITEHAAFGGVVPEIASRAHLDILGDLIRAAMQDAGITFKDLTGVAATAGPGLIGGLLVGVTQAKAIALASGRPFIGVNHLEAHALTVGLTEGLRPPYLLLLISGGHTQFQIVTDVGSYQRLGTTVDDALGEAFDKTAKLLGLDFPGGPQVERWGSTGNPDRFDLPRPMFGRTEPNFSFAGLKTAVRQCAQAIAPLGDRDIADLCASFERAVAETVADRVMRAIGLYEAAITAQTSSAMVARRLVVAGGVAANRRLRAALEATATACGYSLHIPPPGLCTDNGAMIAWTGAEWLARGRSDPLDLPARARWPLDEAAAPMLGAGRLGHKA